jgi:hypothetical protein
MVAVVSLLSRRGVVLLMTRDSARHLQSFTDTDEMRKQKDRLRYLRFSDSMFVMPEAHVKHDDATGV